MNNNVTVSHFWPCTAKAIQCIVYRSLVKYEETTEVIQCIVYHPVVSHEETTKAIQFILYRSLVLPQLKFVQSLAAQQA